MSVPTSFYVFPVSFHSHICGILTHCDIYHINHSIIHYLSLSIIFLFISIVSLKLTITHCSQSLHISSNLLGLSYDLMLSWLASNLG